MKKFLGVLLLLLVIFMAILIVHTVKTYLLNKHTLEFNKSPRYKYLSKESIDISYKLCTDGWEQIGYDKDEEHVKIWCRDGKDYEIKFRLKE